MQPLVDEYVYVPGWGCPGPLLGGRLPRRFDVACHLMYKEKKFGLKRGDLVKNTCQEVVAIWAEANLPTINFKNVVRNR